MVFKIGSPVTGHEFIDRKAHIPELKRYLDHHQHVTIKAPRRYGKTSLIRHTLEQVGGYDYIYIDIRRATDLQQLAQQILEKAYEHAGIQHFWQKAKSSLMELLKSIQKVKLEEIGEVTLQFSQNQVDETEFFLHALDAVEHIASQQAKQLVFVMDEFQDIQQLGNQSAKQHLLDKMRAVMQHHAKVTYVFLGSVESMMTTIFEDKKSAFFHFSVNMNLPGLDIDELFDYAQSYFQYHHFKIDSDALLQTLQFLNGHPDYSARVLQKILFTGLENNKQNLNQAAMINCIAAVFMDNKAYLEELIAKTKLKKHHYEVLYNQANQIPQELSAATLYQTRVSLENMGLIKSQGRGNYQVVDVLLKLYLNVQQTSFEDVIAYLTPKLSV